MTLFKCTAKGVSPSTREWSFSIHFSSGHTTAQVEADWLAQASSFWTNGAHGVDTLFPVATTLQTTRTASLAVVAVGPINKLREQQVVFDNPALAGTSANPSLPDQNAILVSLRTAVPGRVGRGRIHLPAPDETLVVASELTAVSATRVSTSVQALLTGMGAAGHQAVLVTAVLTKTGVPVGNVTNVNFAETDRIVRTMRTRNKRERAVYV